MPPLRVGVLFFPKENIVYLKKVIIFATLIRSSVQRVSKDIASLEAKTIKQPASP
jgi:hypothetical protein